MRIPVLNYINKAMIFSGNKEQSMGETIKEWIKHTGVEKKIEETRLLEKYEDIVGPLITKHTVSKRIERSILYIKLDSASLRHELSYARDQLKKQLNLSVGKDLIKDIVFT